MSQHTLEELIASWRRTANMWEERMDDIGSFGMRAEAQPPDKGRAALRNWINWLRECAADVERLMPKREQK